MRSTAKQYARAIIDACRDRNQSEIRAAIGRALALIAGRDRRLLRVLTAAVQSELERESGSVKAQVRSVRPLGAEAEKQVREIVRAATGRDQVTLESGTDSALIGGAVIRVEDSVIDLSLRGRINRLRSVLKK